MRPETGQHRVHKKVPTKDYRSSFVPMTVKTANEWLRLDLLARAELIVSDERREWILATYPFSDTGRPGILAHEPLAPRPRKKTADIKKHLAKKGRPKSGPEQEPEDSDKEFMAAVN